MYAAIFIDEYSRFVWFEPLKAKSEIRAAFARVKAHFEATVGTPTDDDGKSLGFYTTAEEVWNRGSERGREWRWVCGGGRGGVTAGDGCEWSCLNAGGGRLLALAGVGARRVSRGRRRERAQQGARAGAQEWTGQHGSEAENKSLDRRAAKRGASNLAALLAAVFRRGGQSGPLNHVTGTTAD